MSLKPPFKAVGGKRWLAEWLAAEIMTTKPARYVEPFLGGGAVALALPEALPKILSDANPHFVEIWRALRDKPRELSQRLEELASAFPNTVEGYASARIKLNTLSMREGEIDPALVLHILARCFNGIWRVNRAGTFNVPWGKAKKPRTLTYEEISRYSAALQTAHIYRADCFKMLPAATASRARVAIYADPPYDGTYAGYTADKFGEAEQRSLAVALEACKARGASIWATNSDTPLIREIYSWASSIEPIIEQHSVGAKANRRGQRGCVLIRG